MILTFVVMLLSGMGQPALLYLVPFTLITSAVVAGCRGEMKQFWAGDVYEVSAPAFLCNTRWKLQGSFLSASYESRSPSTSLWIRIWTRLKCFTARHVSFSQRSCCGADISLAPPSGDVACVESGSLKDVFPVPSVFTVFVVVKVYVSLVFTVHICSLIICRSSWA